MRAAARCVDGACRERLQRRPALADRGRRRRRTPLVPGPGMAGHDLDAAVTTPGSWRCPLRC